jgi:hypothetical protein
MEIRKLSAVAIAVGVLTACASDTQPPSQAVSLATLPFIQASGYRVDPYIEAAGNLQAKGKKAAFQQLFILAHSPLAEATIRIQAGGGVDEYEKLQKIAVLCRMLFTQRPGSEFKRPELGGPSFLGDDRPFGPRTIDDPIFKTWPLEPIELVDDVPFAVAQGYTYQGPIDPAASESYVRYCITNCDWSSTRFSRKSKQQKETALQKLISSTKWERPLKGWEREYLKKQVE